MSIIFFSIPSFIVLPFAYEKRRELEKISKVLLFKIKVALDQFHLCFFSDSNINLRFKMDLVKTF